MCEKEKLNKLEKTTPQQMISENQFNIRSYGFRELAGLYSPHTNALSASRKLSKWININSKLKSELSELGFYSGIRVLSPKMVEIIIKYVGEP